MSFKKRFDKAFPLIVLIIFLFIGLQFKRWDYACYTLLLIPFYSLTFKRRSLFTMYPALMIILHLSVGFIFDAFKVSWLFYLTIPVYYILFTPRIDVVGKTKKVFGINDKDDDNIIDN